tara:strand:- start:2821 stop:3135 length:315 start_codon:yes stop_codon:yes gene_type:complete
LAKKNKDDYTESLERDIKQLKALNRQLMRRLKKLDRNFKAIEELTDSERYEDDKEVAKEEAKAATRCPKCLQGRLVSVTFMNRTLNKCSQCDYRTKAEITKDGS